MRSKRTLVMSISLISVRALLLFLIQHSSMLKGLRLYRLIYLAGFAAVATVAIAAIPLLIFLLAMYGLVMLISVLV